MLLINCASAQKHDPPSLPVLSFIASPPPPHPPPTLAKMDQCIMGDECRERWGRGGDPGGRGTAAVVWAGGLVHAVFLTVPS